MGVTVEWDNAQHTILRYTFTGQWTWEEFAAAFAEARALAKPVRHPVYYILDVRAMTAMPSGALARLRNIHLHHHGEDFVSVVVGSDPTIEALYILLTRTYKAIAKRYQFAETLEEARALLRAAQDQSDLPGKAQRR